MEPHTITMRAILLSGVFAAIALSVAGAPTYTDGEVQQFVNQKQIEDMLRNRRSQYAPQFVSPCAAASAMQIPVSTFAAPYQRYAVPQYGYAVPHYRSVDEQAEQELLGFSDMDFMQDPGSMARMGSYGGAPVAAVSPALTALGGRVLSQATTGPALGVFPNANVGGCNVPLLFSCSPTIVPGRMMESQPHTAPLAGGVVDSYRLVDEPVHHNLHDQHQELLAHEHMNTDLVHEPSHVTHQ